MRVFLRDLKQEKGVKNKSVARSLIMDDGDGRENITFKMIPCFFKLCRVYSNFLKMSNVAKVPWS